MQIEIWLYDGTPQGHPKWQGNNIQEARNYLLKRTYKSGNSFYGYDGQKVFVNDIEISLNNFLSDDDFFTSKEWEQIIN